MSALKQEFCDCTAPGSVEPIKATYTPPKTIQGHIVRDAASVKGVQNFLDVGVDGQWGNKTSTAFYERIAQLQRDNGLEVSGAYNEQTAKIMRENGFGQAADALDKLKKEGILDRVYNEKHAKILCDSTKPAANDEKFEATTSPLPKAAGNDTCFNKFEQATMNVAKEMGIKDPQQYTNQELAVQAEKYIHGVQERAGLPIGIVDEKTLGAIEKENPKLGSEIKNMVEALKTDSMTCAAPITSVESGITSDVALKGEFVNASSHFGTSALDNLPEIKTPRGPDMGMAQNMTFDGMMP